MAQSIVGQAYKNLIKFNEVIDHDNLSMTMVELADTFSEIGEMTDTLEVIHTDESNSELVKVKSIIETTMKDYQLDSNSVESRPYLHMALRWLESNGVKFNKKPLL